MCNFLLFQICREQVIHNPCLTVFYTKLWFTLSLSFYHMVVSLNPAGWCGAFCVDLYWFIGSLLTESGIPQHYCADGRKPRYYLHTMRNAMVSEPTSPIYLWSMGMVLPGLVLCCVFRRDILMDSEQAPPASAWPCMK